MTKATKDVTYKAKFKKTERTFMITWLDDEGKLIDFTEVKYGKLPTHEDPKKKASEKYTYTFAGWEPKLAKAKADATYTATFKKEGAPVQDHLAGRQGQRHRRDQGRLWQDADPRGPGQEVQPRPPIPSPAGSRR